MQGREDSIFTIQGEQYLNPPSEKELKAMKETIRDTLQTGHCMPC